MAADRESSFVIKLDGDEGNISAVLNSLKSRIRSDAKEIEAAGKVELFKNTKENADAALKAFFDLSKRAAAFRQQIDEIKGAGGDVGKDLVASLKTTEKAVAQASREYNKQSDALARLTAQLKTAGVDVTKLASEEQRLAAAVRAAAQAETERQAKTALGLRTLKDVTPEIQRLHAAYNTLWASGSLSVKELAQAQQLLRTRVSELRSQVTGLGGAVKSTTPQLAQMFTGSVLPALGLATSIATVVTALDRAIEGAKEFQTNVARIGTVTDVSKQELDALGDGARRLASDLGLNVNDVLRELFELIRSGVPTNNALDVLRASAIAAKASVTDLGAGAKAADALIGGFGLSVDQLGPALDAVIAGSKAGGATLRDFADNAGPLLAVARALPFEFTEILAVLTTMVDATGDASGSFSQLTRILQQLNTGPVRQRLAELGIDTRSLAGIFQQLAERGIPLDAIIGDLGIGSARAAGGVAALTSRASELPDKLTAIANASGASAAGLRAVFDSPAERSARFNAQLSEAAENVGAFLLKITFAKEIAGQFARSINVIPERFKALTEALKDPNASLTELYGNWLRQNRAIIADKVALESLDPVVAGTADRMDRLKISTDRANQALENQARKALVELSQQLLASVQALQQAAARDIADAEARANAQIAALDRTTSAMRATADETLKIQLDLAAERLKIIQKEEVDVLAALEKALAARAEVSRNAGKTEQAIAIDAAQARIAALAPVLAQYQAHYNALLAQQQQFVAKAEGIERSRVELQKSVEAELRSIRLSGLSGLDEFVEKNREIDRLISEGRRAAAQGDVDAAKQYFAQAIAESKGLTEVINADGVKLVTALQARTAKTEALKKIADAVNDSLGDQGKAAQAGADATKKAIEQVEPVLAQLRGQFDAWKATLAKGIETQVRLDQASVADAFRTLDALSQDREVVIRVRTEVDGGGGATVGDATAGFAKGGPVRPMHAMAQAYALGGHVFRALRSPKVPGVGNRDTVAARLHSGSFVVRKSASEYYGDGFMGALARGSVRQFAIGGRVKKDEPERPQFREDGTPVFYKADGTAESPFFGDVKAGTKASQRSFDAEIFGEPELPSDPRELERKILEYANAVVVAARSIDGSDFWAPAIRAIAIDQKDYESRPTTEKLAVILRRARGIGLNLGITKGTHEGFDVDGRRFHKRAAKAPAGLANARLYEWDFYKDGGEATAGSDTVRALLTPGEFVLKPEAVRAVSARFGSGFLDAINGMRISREALANVGAAPDVQRFAEGGRVLEPGQTAGRVLQPAVTDTARGVFNININAAADALLSEANVRRLIVPVLENIARRSSGRATRA